MRCASSSDAAETDAGGGGARTKAAWGGAAPTDGTCSATDGARSGSAFAAGSSAALFRPGPRSAPPCALGRAHQIPREPRHATTATATIVLRAFTQEDCRASVGQCGAPLLSSGAKGEARPISPRRSGVSGSPADRSAGPPRLRTCGIAASGASKDGFATRSGEAPVSRADTARAADASPPRRASHAASGGIATATTRVALETAEPIAADDCPSGQNSRSALVAGVERSLLHPQRGDDAACNHCAMLTSVRRKRSFAVRFVTTHRPARLLVQ